MTQVTESERSSVEPTLRGVHALSAEEREQVRNEVTEACQPIAQSWPMKTFAYRNPLRGWEHLPFDTAIGEAKHLLGGSGYLPNDDYRQLYHEGSIAEKSIKSSLESVVSSVGAPTITIGDREVAASDVLRLHLVFGFSPLDPALLTWQLGGGGATERFRSDLPPESMKPENGDASYVSKLWESTLSALGLSDHADHADEGDSAEGSIPDVALPSGRTLSDWLELLVGTALVDQINDQMIKWTGAFLDEGMADWAMPDRHDGFYHAWRKLAARDFSGRFLGIKQFTKKVRELPDVPEDAIAFSLQRLGMPEQRWTDYLARQFAQLPGWTGFIRWLSENPGYSAQQRHPVDPLQYLAVRLFYEVELVDAFCRKQWGIEGTLPALVSYWEDRVDEYHRRVDRDAHSVGSHTMAVCNDAWRLFHLAQFLELSPGDVARLSSTDARILLGWLDALPTENHGPIWIDALESTIREQLIERLAKHRGSPSEPEDRPQAQLVLCIDVRSESFRRHIEDQGPYETFGYAGFFGIAMSYQALDSAERAALCPVIVAPGFEVDEVPRAGEDETLKMYAAGSRWSRLGHHMFHDLKSNPVGSFMLIDMLGLFYIARLMGKTFVRAPYEAIKARTQGWFSRAVATQTPVDRADYPDGEPDHLPHGFSPAEEATIVEKGLRAIGLTRNFGRFIVACGHGSTSDNNPYFAAYNCGACGGGHGDPNARVFAAMANQPHVRQTLKDNGLDIPGDSWFLAAKHDTATDQVSFYDLEDVPTSHADDLRRLQDDLAEAGRHQAMERCHRIPQAPTDISPQAAAEHMVSRTVDWANVRPEWGLSSNAAFILGRRALTKGLDLGGRVFLHSYDPDADTEGAFLEALMNAPLVVAQWISMEYYFSAVDPSVYGSGSKVTHNVVSGIGVMHGSHGDLQSGLPLQSVNDGAKHYHQPVRLLAIIEAPMSRISGVIEKHTLLQHLFHNQWVHLVAVDPTTREFHRYRPDSTWEACVET
ncbi:MAG: DUF2309 domain-containing protein [Planctomycetota bacterium]|nr:DUF2309 domain-containing protein [Planctomycetota bacterium]